MSLNRQAGIIVSLKDGVAEVIGLRNAVAGEMVISEKNYGIVLNLEKTKMGVVFLTEKNMRVGSLAYKTNSLPSLSVSVLSLGNVINPVGEILGESNLIRDVAMIQFNKINRKVKIDEKAPGIIGRQSVYEPVSTGVKMIDSLIPIGCGQRELIIGDRQTGKTSIVIDAFINQIKYPFIYKKD
jgi:F-type H+/Na+-transporting ATPase subunit alpha